MALENNKIDELSKKLDDLLSMHNAVSNEIDSLRVEIIRLKVQQKQTLSPSQSEQSRELNLPIEKIEQTDNESLDTTQDPSTTIQSDQVIQLHPREYETITPSEAKNRKKKKFDIEKLIGENLINKIGILVLVIGVAIGAKYTIENDLISPLTRIILGYLTGITLLGLGMYLKKNYLNFSSVLVSGAMSILYFITFFAYDFYHLISQEVSFGLMVLFTIFTVLAALNYNKEIIAHLGLVGAISIPFLLSNDTGNAMFLFSYLTLINLGIAFISLKKNWKLLFYSAFTLTWIVYFSWIVLGYDSSKHFILALSFLAVFFILFYIIFVAYKFIKLKKYNAGDIVILLLNSLIFFSLGYALLSEHQTGNQVLGVFALANALIHFIAAFIINTRKLADRNLFYLIIGLVLSCLTLAIPIQLDGHWVTMMWSAEALVLFYIGRSRQVPFYEYISLVLMSIASISLFQDWENRYDVVSNINTYYPNINPEFLTPFFNPIFLTSLIAILCLGAITWIQFNAKWKKDSKIDATIIRVLDFAIPISFILLIFFSLRIEILNYFNHLYIASGIEPDATNTTIYSKLYDVNIIHRSTIWLIDYTIVFFTIVTLFVFRSIRDIKANWAIIGVNTLIILFFLIEGLYDLSELRENYISQDRAEFYEIGNSFIWMRYLSIGLMAILTAATVILLKKINHNKIIRIISEIAIYLIILWVTTSELINWLDFTERSETYGLALSIFWGLFSVIIIAIGIWKKKKHIRILGITIFGVTLVKLFFFDLANLKTIAKTIVMISLGALMLLTSFLYNKYKIEDEQDD